MKKDKSIKDKVSEGINSNGKTWISDITFPLKEFLVNAMNTGQFIPAIIFVIIFTVLIKIPKLSLTNYIDGFLENILRKELLGWVLFIVLLIIYVIHVKYTKKKYMSEIRRLTEEKDRYQKIVFEKAVKSK